MAHALDLLGDRRLHPVRLGQIADREAALHALGGLLRRRLRLLQRLAPAEPLAERTVARQRRRTRRDEVAEPGQPGERHRIGAQAHAEAGGLGETTSDQGRLRVVAEAHRVHHAVGQCDRVLDRAAEFTADDVVIRVRPQIPGRDRRLNRLRPFLVGARDHGRRDLAGRDLDGQVGAGHRRHPGRVDRRPPR